MRKGFSSSIVILFVFLLPLTLLSGCAKPPTQEVENAEKAIAEAKQKENLTAALDQKKEAKK